jgi:hypothetical protein
MKSRAPDGTVDDTTHAIGVCVASAVVPAARAVSTRMAIAAPASTSDIPILASTTAPGGAGCARFSR